MSETSPVDDLERAELELRGEVDLWTSGELRAALDRLCDAGYRVVVVDLTGVEFLGCVGLGVLVQVHHRLDAGGRRLVLTSASPMIRRVVELTRVDTVLDLRDTRTPHRRMA